MRFERASSARGTPADPGSSLEELLASSAKGDEKAFAELYDQTSSRVY